MKEKLTDISAKIAFAAIWLGVVIGPPYIVYRLMDQITNPNVRRATKTSLEQTVTRSSEAPTTSLKEIITPTPEISKTPDLTDLSIKKYETTIASLDDTLSNNKEDIKRLREEIAEEMHNEMRKELVEKEKLLKESGIEITTEMYSKQGDHFLSAGHYLTAFESYEKADNKAGKIKSAIKAEIDENWSVAFDLYNRLKYIRHAIRVAEKKHSIRLGEEKYVRHIFIGEDELTEEIRNPTDSKSWNARGDLMLKVHSLSEAYWAYKKAGNKEGKELVKQEAEEWIKGYAK